jgi:predicted nicotinamide N-methyase
MAPMTGPDQPQVAGESPAELRQTLTRQFVTAMDTVTINDWAIELLRPRNSDDLISEADFVLDERLPYWADLWPSSRILATYLLEVGAPPSPSRPKLLELGCGLGLVTVAAMRAGFDVLATDYYYDALRFTRANASHALHSEPATRHVDWRHFPGDLQGYDRVVAADVLYEKEYPPLLSAAIAQTLTPDGEAIIADPGRVAAPEFLAGLAVHGLTVVDWGMRRFDEGVIHQMITLYRVKRVSG